MTRGPTRDRKKRVETISRPGPAATWAIQRRAAPGQPPRRAQPRRPRGAHEAAARRL